MKNSGRFKRFVFLIIILLLFAFIGRAQKATEVFIPLGKSPGVSGKYSVIGKIESVNMKDSTITIQQAKDNKTVKIRITATTEIYIDKSPLKQTSQKGSMANIKQDLMAEFKYKDNKPGNPCEWVKVHLK